MAKRNYSKPQGQQARKQELIRLNKYIANSGLCSRREADKLIESGAITINGKVVTRLGTKVTATDEVRCGSQRLRPEKNYYVLLNKPKDFITTTDDPQERKTVVQLIKHAAPARLYPVGRLDRNTTGVLLMTNDGALAKKLTHPRHGIRKVYHATIDKPVTAADLQSLVSGINLEDGLAQADVAAWVGDGSERNHVGIELHIGRNKVVRRMFEALGYRVLKLDRVAFAGLTKKSLPRGKWRHLTPKEVGWLKML